MRPTTLYTTLTFILAPISCAAPKEPITDFGLSPELLITYPLEDIRQALVLDLDHLQESDQLPALKRIQELPKLETLRFYDGDLSHVDEKAPIPAKVKHVLIAGGKISQGTFRWLAKFPSGTEITIGGCDVRKLDLKLGNFKNVMFDNCQMSRSAIAKLVEKSFEVTFKEITLEDDK